MNLVDPARSVAIQKQSDPTGLHSNRLTLKMNAVYNDYDAGKVYIQ